MIDIWKNQIVVLTLHISYHRYLNRYKCLAAKITLKVPQKLVWVQYKYIETSMQCRINSLGPSDAIWWHRSKPTLVQVMACCLMAPSHYLNQCRLIINKFQRHSYKKNFTRNSSAINHWSWLQNYLSKISFKSPRGQWVKKTKAT